MSKYAYTHDQASVRESWLRSAYLHMTRFGVVAHHSLFFLKHDMHHFFVFVRVPCMVNLHLLSLADKIFHRLFTVFHYEDHCWVVCLWFGTWRSQMKLKPDVLFLSVNVSAILVLLSCKEINVQNISSPSQWIVTVSSFMKWFRLCVCSYCTIS